MSVDEESLEDKPKYEFLCVYLSKLALLDYDCTVKFLPSLVAASVIFLARLIVKPQAHPWADSLALTGEPHPERHLVSNVLFGLYISYLPVVLQIEDIPQRT
uniref:Cyclin C-terminal domain-containing protein n=1 Tax=Cannabis sativa TaxID=3483 RepID=A0A803PB09_CANSA